MITFNKIGKVIKGEYPGWYIAIIDCRRNDQNNLKTGGIYIFQSESIDFITGEVYDDWVLDNQSLEHFFSEPDWEIDWLNMNCPKHLSPL